MLKRIKDFLKSTYSNYDPQTVSWHTDSKINSNESSTANKLSKKDLQNIQK